MTAPPLIAQRRATLNRRSVRLAYVTAGYNLLVSCCAGDKADR